MTRRLIDADVLQKKFEGLREKDIHATGRNAYDLCAMLTEDAPTIDAVEVVRCKDCKRRGTENCAMTFNTEDNGYYLTDWTSDDGFCSWGERKEE